MGKVLQVRQCRDVYSRSRLESSAGVGTVTGVGFAYQPVSSSVLLFRLISLKEAPTPHRPQAVACPASVLPQSPKAEARPECGCVLACGHQRPPSSQAWESRDFCLVSPFQCICVLGFVFSTTRSGRLGRSEMQGPG